MNRRRCVTSNEAVPAKRQHLNPCSDPGILRRPADTKRVFATPQEFVAHHVLTSATESKVSKAPPAAPAEAGSKKLMAEARDAWQECSNELNDRRLNRDPTVGDTRMGTPHTDPDHRLCSHPDCVAAQKRAADVAEAQRVALDAMLEAIENLAKAGEPRETDAEAQRDQRVLGVSDRVIEAREAYRLAMGAGDV